MQTPKLQTVHNTQILFFKHISKNRGFVRLKFLLWNIIQMCELSLALEAKSSATNNKWLSVKLFNGGFGQELHLC